MEFIQEYFFDFGLMGSDTSIGSSTASGSR